MSRPINVRGKPLAGGRVPALCAPLVGRTLEELLGEARKIRDAHPDVVEWRVDFFARINDRAAVLDAGRSMRELLPGVPLLFTRRSPMEGGQATGMEEGEVPALYAAVCEAGFADLVDYEMSRDPAHVRAVHEASRRHGVALVLSFHDFGKTPSLDFLMERFRMVKALQGDVAKVAVMPRSMDDVLTLLEATLRASRAMDIPLISMSMGAQGALSRVVGFAFGSALSFGVGAASSAPGQIELDALRSAVDTLRRSLGQ